MNRAREHVRGRRAFSLAEVMLIIFLVIMVGGVFVVWVAHERDRDGRHGRSQTNCNLKQCALAVHNYHDTYRKFPPGFSDGGLYVNDPKSLWFHLLPYVEADGLYRGPQPEAIIPAFTAPADRWNADQTNALNFAANLRVFAFQSLVEAGEDPNVPGQAVQVPAGRLRSGLTMGRLTSMDGTSNVLMLSTRYAACGNSFTHYAANVDGSNMTSPNIAGGFMGAGKHTASPSRKGTLDDMFQETPTRANCIAAPGVFGHSFGSGGMSMALADGSVKNISPTMTPTTFTRALCPGDKQNLGLDWAED